MWKNYKLHSKTRIDHKPVENRMARNQDIDNQGVAISQNNCSISGELSEKGLPGRQAGRQAGRQEEMMMWEWTGAGHIGRLSPASCM